MLLFPTADPFKRREKGDDVEGEADSDVLSEEDEEEGDDDEGDDDELLSSMIMLTASILFDRSS